jgi:hypothetical protein
MSLLEEIILRFVLSVLGLGGSILSSIVASHQFVNYSNLPPDVLALHIIVGSGFAVISLWLASWAAVCTIANRRQAYGLPYSLGVDAG